MRRAHLGRTILVGLLVAFSTFCSDDEGIVGVFSPGAPARVVYTSKAAVGGYVYYDTLVVDSATARYDEASCRTPISQGVCDEILRRSAAVSGSVIEQLFVTAQSKEFRNLRALYNREGDYVPPDGSSARLTVTVAERTRTISWAGGATLPVVLSDYQCLLLAARGAFLCN